MTPKKIQRKIKAAGYTQSALAREYGCSMMQVSRTILTSWGSEPLMTFIAEKLGYRPEKVFPKYFNRAITRRKKAA